MQGLGRTVEPVTGTASVRSRQPGQAGAGTLVGSPASPGVALGRVIQVRHTLVDVADAGSARRASPPRRGPAGSQGGAGALQRKMLREADESPRRYLRRTRGSPRRSDLLGFARRRIDWVRVPLPHGGRRSTVQVDRLAQLDNDVLAVRASDLRDLAGACSASPWASRLWRSPIPTRRSSFGRPQPVAGRQPRSHDRSSASARWRERRLSRRDSRSIARDPSVSGLDGASRDSDGTPVLLDGSEGLVRSDPSLRKPIVSKQTSRTVSRRWAAGRSMRQVALRWTADFIEVEASIGADRGRGGRGRGADGVACCDPSSCSSARHAAFGRRSRRSPTRPSPGCWTGRPSRFGRTGYRRRKRGPGPLDSRGELVFGERGSGRSDAAGDSAPQVRLILRAARVHTVSGAHPMVARLEEWQAVREVFEQERRRLGAAAVPAGPARRGSIGLAILADQVCAGGGLLSWEPTISRSTPWPWIVAT